jgi:uncharacterized protein
MRSELKIMGLSHNQSGSYIIVLSEKDGDRKLPVFVSPSNVQELIIKIEGYDKYRLSIHDLFKSFSDSYGIRIVEVYIYSIVEGIYYTKISTTDGKNVTNIECGVGDGITLSTIYGCPLYASKEVMDVASIYLNEDDIKSEMNINLEDFGGKEKNDKISVSIGDLYKIMEEAIDKEEYEIAASIRDRIKEVEKERLKKKNKKNKSKKQK